MFHVSQLKPALLPGNTVSSDLPIDIDLPRVLAAILQHRVVHAGANQVEQVLIQWSDWPSDMATWDDWEAVRQAFPCAPAWGQAGSQAPGNVSTSSTTGSPEEETANGPRRSNKSRKPNKNVTGEVWA